MYVYSVIFGIFLIYIFTVCGNEITTQNPQLVGDDYGTDDIQRILEDPNFDIEKMTVRIGSNGEIHKTHLIEVGGNQTDDKLGVVPKKKIIGGRTAKAGEVPYIVALYAYGTQTCGGSIFNKNYILTAAHCFHNGQAAMSDRELQAWTVVAGDNSVSYTEPNEQKRKIEKAILHPKYDSEQSTYDVALLKVDKPFVYDHFVQPIPIGSPPIKPAGDLWVSGWGYTKVVEEKNGNHEGAYYPDKLKTTKVHYVSDAACKQMYSGYKRAHRFVDSGVLFCAGVPKGGTDACQGDSGGPLVCLDRDPNSKRSRTQKWVCGVVSTGFGCGLEERPGFYTKLAHPEVKKFINQNASWGDKPTRLY